MINIKISVPKEMKKDMDKYTKKYWSRVVREAFEKKLKEL